MLSDLLPVGFSRSQRAMATLVEREFTAAGFPLEMVAAAVVNAFAESSLNPKAIDPSGTCVGLFQLHEAGAGHGLTVEQRQDPVTNTRRILRVLQGYQGRPVLDALAAGVWDVAALTGLFCRHVERPARVDLAVARREALARSLFPTLFVRPDAAPGLLPWPGGAFVVLPAAR